MMWKFKKDLDMNRYDKEIQELEKKLKERGK